MFGVRDAEGERSGVEGLVGVVIVAVVLVAMGLFVNSATYDSFVGLIMVLVLTCITLPVLAWMTNADGEPELFKILAIGFFAKMAFTLVRYINSYVVYNGVADAASYDKGGWKYAQRLSLGSLNPQIPFIEGIEDATRRVMKITGYVYWIVGHSQFAAYFFFSFLAYVGAVLALRGARQGFPEMDHKRAAWLAMLLPTLLFWPSGIGKDSVMVFFLGVATWGAGYLLGPRPRVIGVLPVAVALWGMTQFRSHVALMAVLAITLAFAVSLLGGRGGADGGERRLKAGQLFGRVFVLVVLVVGSLFAVSQTAAFFSNSSKEADSTEQALQNTFEQTQVGGSAFEPVRASNPINLLPATVSVMYRPYPWEVHNGSSLIAGVEAAIVLVLTVVSWRRLKQLPKALWYRPFVAFLVTYALLFVFGFSNFANFGILARQRSQMYLLFGILLAIPAASDWVGRRTESPRRRSLIGGGDASASSDASEVPEIVAGSSTIRPESAGVRTR